MTTVLDDRRLGRATLARQLLLERSGVSALDAVRQLVGLQSQNPLDPYLALWSRLDGFDVDTIGAGLEDRTLVRIVVMRGTIHLLTADDARFLRPLMQPVLDAEIARHRDFAPPLVGIDLAPMLAFAHTALTATPMSGTALRAAITARFPDAPAAAVAYACRCKLPLVQVPPRGVWGRTLQVTSTPLDTWVGQPLEPRPSIAHAVLRYLVAFGPATVADAAAWSRLTGLREVFETLRPQLRTFRDGRGRELFDVPDGPLPDPDTPAPVRFLPEYDNVLLSHADRSRFVADAPAFAAAGGPFKGTVLVDGLVRAIWHSTHDRATGRGTLVVEHLALARRALASVEAEARRVARFWLPTATDHVVTMAPLA